MLTEATRHSRRGVRARQAGRHDQGQLSGRARTVGRGGICEFLEKYPAVRLQLHVSNRRVDVLSEGLDVALRVRSIPTGEDGLVMRSFRTSTNSWWQAPPIWVARVTPTIRRNSHSTIRSTTRGSPTGARGNSLDPTARSRAWNIRRAWCAMILWCCVPPCWRA